MKHPVLRICLLLLAVLIIGSVLVLRTLQPADVPEEAESAAADSTEPEPIPDEAAAPDTASESDAETPEEAPEGEPAPVTRTGVLLRLDGEELTWLPDDGTEETLSLADAALSAPETLYQGYPVTLTFDAAGSLLSAEISDFSALTAEEAAQNILKTLSTEEKVGQLFLARYPDQNAAETAARLHLGGYILFGRDFSGLTAEEVQAKTAAVQAASTLPMLLAVDEEGGTVCRVSSNTALRAAGRFASPQELYAAGGLEAIAADTTEKCSLLSSLGLNVNMAPVCDVSQDANDFIYKRSFGRSAAETAEYVRTVVETMQGTGVGCVLKHFPGYGNNTDTHTGIAYDHRSYDTFTSSDFLPFSAGIAAGAGAVLVSHNIVDCMDPDRPASLSAEVHRILREELGFTGVAITDDLAMDAIGDYCGSEAAAVQAVLAGNDLLCCTDFETQLPAVLAAVQDGTISQGRLDEAAGRVLCWKVQLGLFS